MSILPPFHPTAPHPRRHYADWAHGQIHYYDGGGTGLALMLLHQSPASSSDWFPLLPYFEAAGVRILAMDTPGMGLSDPLPFAPTIQDFAAAVKMVIDHAGVESVHLLGHHTGVQIAVEAALRYPEQIRSASLYGVPVFSAGEADRLWQQIVPRQKALTIHQPIKGGKNLIDYIERIETQFGTVAAQRMLLSGLMAGPLWWHGHNAAFHHDVVPALLSVTKPLLLLSHTGDMLESHTKQAARLRPDAVYVNLLLDGALAMDTAPDRLADAVITFIQGLP